MCTVKLPAPRITFEWMCLFITTLRHFKREDEDRTISLLKRVIGPLFDLKKVIEYDLVQTLQVHWILIASHCRAGVSLGLNSWPRDYIQRFNCKSSGKVKTRSKCKKKTKRYKKKIPQSSLYILHIYSFLELAKYWSTCVCILS